MKISEKAITLIHSLFNKNSESKRLRIFMTGASGIIGSDLLATLLRKGHYVVCLIRSKNEISPYDRLEECIGQLPENCYVINGDITQNHCGINEGVLTKLKDSPYDLMIHCAASVKMDQSNAITTELINVNGTKNIIELTKYLNINKLHYISTAYVNNGDSNPYVITKRKAENIVSRSGLPYTICRLSITIGDSKSGKINGFSGYYALFSTLYMIANKSRKKRNGYVNMPLCIDILEDARINLIPIDWVSKMLTHIIEDPSITGTINMVHPNPPKMGDVFRESLRILKIRGIEVNKDKIHSKHQRIILSMISVFNPYMTKQIDLENNLANYLKEKYQPPPDISQRILKRVLTYAIDKKFGRVPKLNAIQKSRV